jgi:hypothetical protein
MGNMYKWAAVVIAAVCAYPASGHCERVRKSVKFDAAQSEAVGPVEKLSVTVTCGRIVALRNVPELYEIRMLYELPTVNVLESRPRLAAAAITLKQWSGVIRTAGEGSCFRIAVRAKGRSGQLQVDIE